jgi:Ser/Thr protein kinase RdoA (MazF antagonist)
MSPQKHISSTHARLIPAVLAHFKLGSAQFIDPIQEAYANDNYFVETEQGVFAIKFLQEPSPATIANDIAIGNQLKLTHLATPTYLEDEFGEVLHSVEDNSVVVSEKIQGIIPQNRDSKLNFEIGKVLATFHTRVKALPEKRVAWLNPQLNEHSAERSMEIFKKDLPRGIIHGDLHSENVHVDSEEMNNVIALFDFECSEENLYIVDIARSILSVCHTNIQEIDQDRFDSLIDGYQSVRLLQTEERNSLPLAINYVSRACIAWFKQREYVEFAKKFDLRTKSFTKIEI